MAGLLNTTINQQIRVSYRLALLAGFNKSDAGLIAAKSIAAIHGLNPMEAIGQVLIVDPATPPTTTKD